MDRRQTTVASIVLVLVGASILAESVHLEKPGVRAPKSRVKTVTVKVVHPQFPGFEGKYELEVGKKAFIHDTTYWLRLEDFAADFMMNPMTGDILSRSNELKNPAARVTLGNEDQTLYLAWIFQAEDAPHQVRSPGFVITVDHVDR